MKEKGKNISSGAGSMSGKKSFEEVVLERMRKWSRWVVWRKMLQGNRKGDILKTRNDEETQWIGLGGGVDSRQVVLKSWRIQQVIIKTFSGRKSQHGAPQCEALWPAGCCVETLQQQHIRQHQQSLLEPSIQVWETMGKKTVRHFQRGARGTDIIKDLGGHPIGKWVCVQISRKRD